MKIIELLNKMANGEEVPTTIKYQDNYYNLIRKYNEDWEKYEFGYKNLNGGYLNIWRDSVLNDTVEIIEEKKKIPEKLESYISCGWYGTCKDLKREELFEDLKKIGSKINEIVDYLKSKGE